MATVITNVLAGYGLQATTGINISQIIWPAWNGIYGAGANPNYGVYPAAMNIDSADLIWPARNFACDTATSSTHYIWVNWNGAYRAATVPATVHYAVAPLTTEQIAGRAARIALRESADARAASVLGFVLNPEQRRRYERDREFEVVVGASGERRRYLIQHGWAGNVYRLDAAGRKIERLCIHPEAQIPIADNLVAQKLLLESNEAEFRRIANKTPLAA